MYLVYLGEVMKRAFTPTPRLTDGLQVAAASALPAVASFAGVDLPATAQGDALAYIGLAVVSFFVIRLFWAPYSMWKEQAAEIGGLKLELTKPERLVLQHLAKHRAKAIIKLQGLLTDIHAKTYTNSQWKEVEHIIAGKLHELERLINQAGLPASLFDKIAQFMIFCTKNRPKTGDIRSIEGLDESEFIEQCLNIFNGSATAGSLALRLPPSIG